VAGFALLGLSSGAQVDSEGARAAESRPFLPLAEMFGVQQFHCQDCHQYQTSEGPYKHYFHPGMGASLPKPVGVWGGILAELAESPASDEQFGPVAVNLGGAVLTIDEGSDYRMDCHTFNACHEDPPGLWGLCGQNHDEYGGGGSEVIAAVLEATAANSLSAMNKVEAKYPRFVRVVADREVVLLLSCKGELVRQERFSNVASD